jgi:hypothetical protein
MKRLTIAALLLMASIPTGAFPQSEAPLFDLNAYAPLPSPDGKHLAYLLTGRKLFGGSGGTGRSNLQSQIEFSDTDGKMRQNPNVEGFLGEWLPDSTAVYSFRDWRFAVVTPNGKIKSGSMPGLDADRTMKLPERAAYLSRLKKFVWIEDTESGTTILRTLDGPLAIVPDSIFVGSLIVPSPDERYLAFGGRNLVVYDTVRKTWANLGPLVIHPDSLWDYIKPNWNPWFFDSKYLAFFSGSELYVVSPDGTERLKLLDAEHGGLAIPSPDGTFVAFATFTPRPMRDRPDLNFWGGSVLWIVPTSGGLPRKLTNATEDQTCDLRWLTSTSLIFDRIASRSTRKHESGRCLHPHSEQFLVPITVCQSTRLCSGCIVGDLDTDNKMTSKP